MKNIVPILFLLLFFTGCNHPKLIHQEAVTTYYTARDKGNYTKLKTVIGDSITIIEGDYVMPYDQDSFYEQFKWDSIFSPSYKIIQLEDKNDQVVAAVTMNSVRNAFLKNRNMTCEYNISFQSGKISKIEVIECADANWGLWQNERDSLVGWIRQNQPKLDGFIYDMTMNGALNYLKAIELYNADKKGLH